MMPVRRLTEHGTKGNSMNSVYMGIGLMIVVAVCAWLITDTQIETTGEMLASKNGTIRLDN